MTTKIESGANKTVTQPGAEGETPSHGRDHTGVERRALRVIRTLGRKLGSDEGEPVADTALRSALWAGPTQADRVAVKGAGPTHGGTR